MLPEPFNRIPQSAHSHHHLDLDEIAFQQGNKTRGLFVVLKGNIELRRFTRAGQMLIIHRAKSGETFAEASLFSASYHCDAIAIQKSHLVELDRRVILEKFHNEPDFALAIAKRFAGQNQYYRRKLELLAINNAQERIYSAVLEGYLAGNIKAFAFDIGLTHEAVYRGLASLVAKGKLIKTGRGKYFLRA